MPIKEVDKRQENLVYFRSGPPDGIGKLKTFSDAIKPKGSPA